MDEEKQPLLHSVPLPDKEPRTWRSHWACLFGSCTLADCASCCLSWQCAPLVFGWNMHRALGLSAWKEALKFFFVTVLTFAIIRASLHTAVYLRCGEHVLDMQHAHSFPHHPHLDGSISSYGRAQLPGGMGPDMRGQVEPVSIQRHPYGEDAVAPAKENNEEFFVDLLGLPRPGQRVGAAKPCRHAASFEENMPEFTGSQFEEEMPELPGRLSLLRGQHTRVTHTQMFLVDPIPNPDIDEEERDDENAEELKAMMVTQIVSVTSASVSMPSSEDAHVMKNGDSDAVVDDDVPSGNGDYMATTSYDYDQFYQPQDYDMDDEGLEREQEEGDTDNDEDDVATNRISEDVFLEPMQVAQVMKELGAQNDVYPQDIETMMNDEDLMIQEMQECAVKLGHVPCALLAMTIAAALYATYFASLRRKWMRERFGIEGSFKSDFMLWLCCPTCALAQETRTLMHNNVEEGIWQGPSPAGQQAYVAVMQAPSSQKAFTAEPAV